MVLTDTSDDDGGDDGDDGVDGDDDASDSVDVDSDLQNDNNQQSDSIEVEESNYDSVGNEDSDDVESDTDDNRKSKKAKHCHHSIKYGEWELSAYRALGRLKTNLKCVICTNTISEFRRYITCINCNQAYGCFKCRGKYEKN